MPHDRLIVASDLSDDVNAALAAHSSHPEIIAVPIEQPWTIASTADVLLVRPRPNWKTADARKPDCWPGRLRWIQTSTAGIDGFPNWLTDGVMVSCARGVYSSQIADYAMAAIFAAAKPFHRIAPKGPGEWTPVPLPAVAGSTLGIVGFGSIGSAVAGRAIANGMTVLGFRRRPDPVRTGPVRMVPDLSGLFARCDHVVLALPDTVQTRGLINATVLGAAKPGLHLMNIGRGTTLDETALRAALETDRLAYATLDVTDPEPPVAGSWLYGHPKVRLTPHLASNFTAAKAELARLVISNYALVLEHRKPYGCVDPAHGY